MFSCFSVEASKTFRTDLSTPLSLTQKEKKPLVVQKALKVQTCTRVFTVHCDVNLNRSYSLPCALSIKPQWPCLCPTFDKLGAPLLTFPSFLGRRSPRGRAVVNWYLTQNVGASIVGTTYSLPSHGPSEFGYKSRCLAASNLNAECSSSNATRHINEHRLCEIVLSSAQAVCVSRISNPM